MVCSSFIKFIICLICYGVGSMIYYGTTEYYRSITYIKNFCQVTKSDIDDSKCDGSNGDQCYQPIWAVLYDKPNIDDEPIPGEIHSKTLLSLSDANARVDQYKVSISIIYNVCFILNILG